MKEYLEILDSLNKKKTILTYERLNSTVEMNESVKKNLICDIPEDYRVFLERFDGGNLGFKKMKNNKYKILHCIMELFPEDWIIISKSFEEFILKLINERGKKFWLS